MKHDSCSGVLNVNHPYSDFILTESSVSSSGNCITKIVLSKMYITLWRQKFMCRCARLRWGSYTCMRGIPPGRNSDSGLAAGLIAKKCMTQIY